MSYQYFQTEDTSYIWAADHNYTTPWDFQRDLTPTHIVIVIGYVQIFTLITKADNLL